MRYFEVNMWGFATSLITASVFILNIDASKAQILFLISEFPVIAGLF
jgi:hypothetical protein